MPLIAEELERMVLNSETVKTKPNYTGQYKERRYYIGYLGELAALRPFLWAKKAIYYAPKCDGVSDKFDFVVKRQGVKKTIDVKTTANVARPNFEILWRQVYTPDGRRKKQTDCFIGVKLFDDHAAIMGFCLFNELQEGTNCHNERVLYMPYTKMHPIHLLIEKLDDGDYVLHWPFSQFSQDLVAKYGPNIQRKPEYNPQTPIITQTKPEIIWQHVTTMLQWGYTVEILVINNLVMRWFPVINRSSLEINTRHRTKSVTADEHAFTGFQHKSHRKLAHYTKRKVGKTMIYQEPTVWDEPADVYYGDRKFCQTCEEVTYHELVSYTLFTYECAMCGTENKGDK